MFSRGNYLRVLNNGENSDDEENNWSNPKPSKLSFITTLINPRSPIFKSIALIATILGSFYLGYISKETTSNIVLSYRPSEVSFAATTVQPWSESGFFYPPLDGVRYPKVAQYNQPDTSENRTRTPLFVPFTRNSEMLAQTVISYIASGWPREDIIVIDNSGTMNANANNLLTPKNPFFLDHHRFRSRYGVSILQTPTLLSFAQLQNFMISSAMARKWKYYFWSHQDVAVLSYEESSPYKSFHTLAVESIEKLKKDMQPSMFSSKERWAAQFYAFDWLTLVNVDAIQIVGSWDIFVPYYATDCDWYERVRMSGLKIGEERAGDIYDLAMHIPDPENKFFPAESATGDDLLPNSSRYKALKDELQKKSDEKKSADNRNTWQKEQTGGKGEPWTYDPKGFHDAWWLYAERGREIFEKKWNVPKDTCGLTSLGKTLKDVWKDAKG